MPEIWQALLDFDTPCSLVTKSPLALRDIDILQDLAAGPGVTVFFSVPTLDERAWRETEPHTPSPRARLEGVRKMNEAGVPSGILIAPVMPGINDSPEQVGEILRIAEDAGAISARRDGAAPAAGREGGLLRLDAGAPARPDAALRGAVPTAAPTSPPPRRSGSRRWSTASGRRGASGARVAAPARPPPVRAGGTWTRRSRQSRAEPEQPSLF